MAYQMAFTLPIVLTGLALATILRDSGQTPTRVCILRVGAASVLVALNGGAGILLGSSLAVWAAIAALRTRTAWGLIAPLATTSTVD